jgi:hypothetical protein
MAMKKVSATSLDVVNGSFSQEHTVEFAAKVLSAEAIVGYVHSEFAGGVDSSKVWSEGQLVTITKIIDKKVTLQVVAWRKYKDQAQTPKQYLLVDIVVIAILEGVSTGA